jgi:dihydroorotate dehydrogenase electron transfer subunit
MRGGETARVFARARILAQTALRPDILRMDLEAPAVAAAAQPGQFVHVRVPAALDPLLPRPFSIHRRIAGGSGVPAGIALLYRIVGRGTRALAALRPGDEVTALGPLGRGFPLEPFQGRTWILAGGMGAAPLLFLAEEGTARGVFAPDRCEILYGGRGAADLVAAEAFRRTGLPVQTAAEDGSEPFRGTALDLLARRLREESGPARVFAVGPERMYPPLRRLLEGRGIPCWISLERRMACGLGVCRSCVAAVRDPSGRTSFADVCSRGPVFRQEEVVLDGMGSGG